MDNDFVYTTYFDIRYMPKGMAMIESLHKVTPGAQVIVLCLDKISMYLMKKIKYPGVTLISTNTLEKMYKELLEAKGNRPKVEYYWTLTPYLCRYVLDSYLKGVVYLDADMIFYESPQAIFDEMGRESVGICPHRFPFYNNKSRYSGWFNVGWNIFKKTKESREVLLSWSRDCLNSCAVDDTTCGDQKYLDKWPKDFTGVHVISHPGADCAPWNFYSLKVKKENGKFYVEGKKLIFFHFHGFNIYKDTKFVPNYAYPITRSQSELYADYSQILIRKINQIKTMFPEFDSLLENYSFSKIFLPFLQSQWVRVIKRIFRLHP